MKWEVLAIKDRALDAFMRPLVVQTALQGIRMFNDVCNAPDQEYIKHPDDYDLYHLGTFDDETGRIENLEKPHCLAFGRNAVQRHEERGNIRNLA